MTESLDIKVLVATHKPVFTPDNSLFAPIQVGAVLADQRIPGVLHDDEGDNISAQPGDEVRAIYWAWKNLDADYYGLFHYRRYLSFANKKLKANNFSEVWFDSLAEAVPALRLDEKSMRAVIEANDLIVPTSGSLPGKSTLYEHFGKEYNIRDLNYCLEYISSKYPQLRKYVEEVKSSQIGYHFNLFIMKRDLFEDYCVFLFDVLDSFNTNFDHSSYNVEESRVINYLAEILTSLYIRYLIDSQGVKTKELQMAVFENTIPMPTISPIVGDNVVPVVLASNAYYVPYVSALLHSLVDHIEPGMIYDVVIFHQDISADLGERLLAEFASTPELSVRLADFSAVKSTLKNVHTFGQFTIETYFRLFIPDVMQGYSKVLYLDGDLTINADLKELYDTDISAHLLAACRDIDCAGQYNGYDPLCKSYMDKTLKLAHPFDYFQAGVILFNVERMRAETPTAKLLKLATSKDWNWLDQDVLNIVAQDKVVFLDPRWNVVHDNEGFRMSKIASRAPLWMYQEYVESRRAPHIIHFAGWQKPWNWPECDFGGYFWKYARRSDFLEVILARMTDARLKYSGNAPGLQNQVMAQARKLAELGAPRGTRRRQLLKRVANAIGVAR